MQVSRDTRDNYLESRTLSLSNYPQSNPRLNGCVVMRDTFGSVGVTAVLWRVKFSGAQAPPTVVDCGSLAYCRAEHCHRGEHQAARLPFGGNDNGCVLSIASRK